MVRLVLPDATPRDAIDDTAAALGLLLLNIVPKTAEYPAQIIWSTPDRLALVHLVDEGAGGALAWMIRADAGADVEARWAEALRGAMERGS